MSAQLLIELLRKLLKLHKSLYQLALEKTEIVKHGDVEVLNSIVMNEQKHINAIRKIEIDQNRLIMKLLPNHDSPSLTECLPLFKGTELELVIDLQSKLFKQLVELKEVNVLNQELLELSLQYVMLNMDLLLPDDVTNYSKKHETEDLPLTKVSLFDSKA